MKRPLQRLCCDEDQCETRRGFRDAQGPDYLGRRPEAIQVAPLIRGIERSSHCTSVVAVTGNTEKCSIRSRANCHCALSPWRHCRGTLRVALGPGDRAALYAAFTSYGRRPWRRKSLRDRQRAGAIGQRYRRRRPQKFTTESDHGHCPHLAGFVWDAAAGPTELLILDCDETTTEALSR